MGGGGGHFESGGRSLVIHQEQRSLKKEREIKMAAPESMKSCVKLGLKV